MAPSRTRFFFFSSWRCSTTSTPILTRARFAGLSIHHHHHHLVIAMPSPRHGGAPLHANAPTLTKITLRRAAQDHGDAPLHQRSTPHEARQEPIHGASYLVSWPQPSAIPPRAYPQRLVPRAPRATALGRPARSPSAAPRASYPTSHSPRPSRQEPIHGASCLVSQTTCHQPPPQEPIHSASCLVHQATTLCPHTDATCLHPSPTMAAGHHRTGLRLG